MCVQKTRDWFRGLSQHVAANQTYKGQQLPLSNSGPLTEPPLAVSQPQPGRSLTSTWHFGAELSWGRSAALPHPPLWTLLADAQHYQLNNYETVP